MRERIIHYDWHNKPQEAFGYKFKSKVEYKWAQYLQKLLELGAIISWEYEPKTFEFGERWRVRKQYTPDFLVKEDGDEVYHEVKTSLRQTDVTRLRCLHIDFPEVRIVLVLFGPEKTSNANQNRLRSNSRKYVERIVFAGPLIRKFGIK